MIQGTETLQGRLKKLAEYFGETQKSILQKIGTTAADLGAKQGVDIQKIERIAKIYPEVSYRWLLMGEGVMIMPLENEVATELKDCQTEKAALKKEISRLKITLKEETKKANAYTPKN